VSPAIAGHQSIIEQSNNDTKGIQMKKAICIGLILVLAGSAVSAQGKQGAMKNRIGLLCNIELVKPVINYTDSVITGFGIKYWLLDELSIRGLIFLNIQNNAALNQTVTDAGFSAGLEYHFIKGIVSPYAGLLAGIEFLSDPTQTGMDYHLGGIFGVEISTPIDYLNFFLEYTLTATFREQGYTIDLGKDHLPSFGFAIYFN
jgi:hypothetical protein